MSTFSFDYIEGCVDHEKNVDLIFRNLAIGTTLLFLLNFFRDFELKFSKLSLAAWILCRYMLVYKLIQETVNKLLGVYYQYSYTVADSRNIEAEPRELLWQVYASSDSLELAFGVGQMLILLLLAFRKTALIGAMLLLPVFLNKVSLALAFESCWKLHYLANGALLTGIIIYMIPNVVEWIKKLELPKLFAFKTNERKLFFGSLGLLKIIVLIGFITQQMWKIDRNSRYYKYKIDHPIVGIWNVDSICTETSEFPEFKKLIFEKGIFGKAQLSDSTTQFQYLVDTLYNQMEFYNFLEYRSLDLKGKYTLIDEETIEYKGKNNKDSLSFTLKKEVQEGKEKDKE